MFETYLNAVVQGVLLGGYYAIIAAGLSLMFGVVRFINLAHGDFLVLGAMLALFAVEQIGWPLWLALVTVLPVMAALGWLMQGLMFERALKGGALVPILVTVGLGAALQNAMFGLFGSNTRSLGAHIGTLSWSGWLLPGGINVGALPALTFVLAVVVLGLLHLVLTHTPLGRAIRATASDPEAAEFSGVDARQVHRAAAATAMALAALGGVLLAMRAQVTPYSGPAQLIFAFEAVVIGGIGSLWGTLVGGIILGVAQTLGGTISAQAPLLAGHLVLLAVLAFRVLRDEALSRGGWSALLRRTEGKSNV
ncbi:branched-chain amino acid ABC transporter permease [Pararhodobacter zhoushanensis]|uniref:Branched-chain amino acid ABC transporter permease n=1 Tax=Pararhodobacter zhoushanensis TaxID=2479545 RepID=A0ABT3H544_9RHOB|nr:branched-chain amino acid ABC transporter permease [Pararhodobacter zhoushanensis]MCW1934932.1 branched-chain amino acid ABC transporter permease [Pararhodobacter zhoushanensis]